MAPRKAFHSCSDPGKSSPVGNKIKVALAWLSEDFGASSFLHRSPMAQPEPAPPLRQTQPAFFDVELLAVHGSARARLSPVEF